MHDEKQETHVVEMNFWAIYDYYTRRYIEAKLYVPTNYVCSFEQIKMQKREEKKKTRKTFIILI